MIEKNEKSLKKEDNTGIVSGKGIKKKIAIIIAVAVTLSFAFLCVAKYIIGNTNQLKRQLDLGNRYLAEMDYEQAIVAFDKAIEIDPKNPDAYLGKAEVYAGLDNTEKALEALETGYQVTGEDEEIKTFLLGIYKEMAKNAIEAGEYEEGKKAYERIVELGGENAKLWELLEKYTGELTKEHASDTMVDTEEAKHMPEDIEEEVSEPEAPESEETLAESAEPGATEPEEPAAESEESDAHAEEGTVETDLTRQDQSAGVRTERADFANGGYSINTFDSSGNRIKREDYNAGGSLYYLATFDGSGNCIKEEEYNEDGSLDKYQLYTYDGSGKLIKTEHYNGESSLNYYYLKTYDGNGNLIKEEKYNGDGSLEWVDEY